MTQFHLDVREVMKNWWTPDKHFKNSQLDAYPTKMLRTLYQYVADMICRLYGEFDAKSFKVSWVPIC
jgi:hypothetical protein